ncbi:MAG: DUF3987 domain-containing protein [Reyranellaceae bacterium]
MIGGARDPIAQFRDAITASGMRPPAAIVADGRLRRFPTSDRKRDDAGWYLLHGDGIPAGAFGDWRTGTASTWHADTGRTVSTWDRALLRQRIEALQEVRGEEQAQRQAEACARAERIWQAATDGHADHPYLTAKSVGRHGLRTYGDALVVPLRDGDRLHSLQFISPEGAKKFLRGGRMRGCYHLIGVPGETLCIAEGYATAASVHEATGHAVAVAFNAGNLLAVVESQRARHPVKRLIVCADDDAATPGNPGLSRAHEAARACGADLAVPVFGESGDETLTDFNDLHRLAGADAVRACVDRAGPVGNPVEGGDWPPPQPIVAELKPVPPFDAETLLPEVLRAWVMDEAERMPCPPEYIAVAALAALGSIVGARCAIKPKRRDSWLIVPNLWGGIVGDPSAKKSPAWGVALRPLDRLIAKAGEANRAALAEHDIASTVFDARKEAIQDRIRKAAKKPDGADPAAIARELREHQEQAPAAPVLRRYKTNDSTIEKLGELLRDNPAGLLVLRDELVGLMATWEREGREGERAFFLEAWNGNQAFDTDRIGRGHVSIANLCVSIFGGIQPDKLTAYLEQAAHALANDGMLQRFQLLVYPDARPWEWRDRAPNRTACDRAAAVFEAVADVDPVDWGAAAADDLARFPHFHFDEEAQAVFVEWSRDWHLGCLPAEDEPIIRQHLAKYDKLFPALALIFHLIDCAIDGPAGAVRKDSALRAAAWCEFLQAHARRCYGLLKDDGLRAAQALAAKLQRGALPDDFTARDVRRNQWRHLTTDEAIQAALDWLEDEDWLRGKQTGGAGRKTVRYSINPGVRRSSA